MTEPTLFEETAPELTVIAEGVREHEQRYGGGVAVEIRYRADLRRADVLRRLHAWAAGELETMEAATRRAIGGTER